MKTITRHTKLLLTIALCCLISSCKKYLDAKTDKTLVLSSSINDAQALMDNYFLLGVSISSVGITMDDDYSILDSYYDIRTVTERLQYTWDKQATTGDYDFSESYTAIVNCNVALETLNKIKPGTSDITAYNLAKGSALFYRAYRHYILMSIYCLQYDKATSGTDLGIPYKISSNLNDKAIRPSLQSNYDAVITDLKTAAEILPTSTIFPTRPTKQAAYGLLARIYLSMNDYPNALLHADACLKIYNTLLDYNNFNPSGTATPFKRFNAEDIFHNTSYATGFYIFTRGNIYADLYNSYDANDLRKSLFFAKNPNGYYGFRGAYDENANQGAYGGIATDEVYLIRAESYARAGNTSAAMSDLNTLLLKRWRNGFFVPLNATNAKNALDIILAERRKELVRRNNLRWTDLKRLNKDPNYAKTLTRTVHGQTYTLPPNDLRYALLIPPTEIALSGMQQNPR
ncbi:MAG: RagB/SusD family nutrient uptake outer membrane protein [Mucilaginibacter sp.]|uniref:RagB/SusD family nutrient uptake outer membrane protein n=1 Tax=Mucilaginibacter sp. TaxID=1882438 RepID=UPI0026347BE0|nr:RagB/SusD family nutrient uptake outer membrane protein [Mucilaginibacter sp.]MDB5004409.1 RagB/SusD family nutrient uptake outer membrane protein [Mucilaginibacter sp.]